MRGDRDSNGVLTFAELANSIAADRQRRNGSRAREQETWNVDGVKITPEHRQYAARWMTREDKNKNGRLESGEIPQDWKTGNFLKWADQNEDGRISRTELQIGAAHWMRDKELAQPLKGDPNMQHCAVLAADMIRRFDIDKYRALNRAEWQRIGGDVSSGDMNGNGLIVEAELSKWLLSRISSQAGADLTEDMPNWFVESDADLDAQVTLAEFVAAQSHNRLSEFQYQDRNSDGIVTPAELSRHGTAGKTRYVSGGQRVLEAKQVVYSEIFIPEEITIADIDVEGVREVDEKLIMLGRQMNAPILTNDFNLNRVAELQGVHVLNINELANAVKSILLPGEALHVRVIQEGKELGQGVGYLDDGTMVVVEEGRGYIGKDIDVSVTKVLQTAAGRMIFSKPDGKNKK